MLRAAYPGLPEEYEKKETTWVRTAYDCAGANGQGPRRLAGVWAPLPIAMALAPSYALAQIVQPLAEAEPDPKGIQRKVVTRSSTAIEQSAVLAPVACISASNPLHPLICIPRSPHRPVVRLSSTHNQVKSNRYLSEPQDRQRSRTGCRRRRGSTYPWT